MPRANRVSNNLVCLIAATITIFLIIITLVVLLIVLFVFIPYTPPFKVTKVTLSKFNITKHAKLTATFNVDGILTNPNIAYSVQYESLDLALWFDNFTIASAPVTQPPFSTRGKTDTPVLAQFTLAHSQLPRGLVSEIKAQQQYHGSVDFGAMLVAQFRYKFGILHSKVCHLTLDCYPLHIALPPNNTGKLVALFDCKVV